MVLKDNKNNAHSKFGWTNKEYYGIFRFGQLVRDQEFPSELIRRKPLLTALRDIDKVKTLYFLIPIAELPTLREHRRK